VRQSVGVVEFPRTFLSPLPKSVYEVAETIAMFQEPACSHIFLEAKGTAKVKHRVETIENLVPGLLN